MMKKFFFLLFAVSVFGVMSNAQVLFEENFDYTVGSLLTANGYDAHSGAGTNPQTVVTPGLTYAGYVSSGIGNADVVNNLGGEDVSKTFALQNVDGTTIYAALLVNCNDASATKTGDYFFHLGNRASATSFTQFCARLNAKITAAGVVNFGISNASTAGTQVYSSVNYATNTTYLIILKYVINQAGNDELYMWVKDAGVPTDEAAAGTPDAAQTTLTGVDTLNAFGLRQGSSANSVSVIVDGIRIATSWSDMIGAAVPVELTSFAANRLEGNVQLQWQTATEKNNSGFDIERKTESTDFVNVGFVKGNGTTTNTSSYTFVDKNAGATTAYAYRLKQVDFDGTVSYSKVVNVSAGEIPSVFALAQNYPNPFNPTTSINYSLPQSGVVTLAIFNSLGQKVKDVVSGFQEAGSHTVHISASDLSSGTYIYKISVNGLSLTKKMVLLK